MRKESNEMILDQEHSIKKLDKDHKEYMQLEEKKEDEEMVKSIVRINNLNNSFSIETKQVMELQKEEDEIFKKFNTGKIKSSGEIVDFYNDIVI